MKLDYMNNMIQFRFNNKKDFIRKYAIPLVGLPWGIIMGIITYCHMTYGYGFFLNYDFLIHFVLFLAAGIGFGSSYGYIMWRYKRNFLEEKEVEDEL